MLTRKLQKVFGDTGAVSNFGIIGSDNISSPDTSKDLDEIQSLSNFEEGLTSITSSGSQPPRLEDINSLYFLVTTQLKYLFQKGVPEWISTEEYFENVSVVQHNGNVYLSIYGDDTTPNINNDPATATSYWRKILSINGSLDPENNLSDVSDAGTLRTNIDVYSKTEVYNTTETYTKEEVNAIIGTIIYTSTEVTSDHTILYTETYSSYIVNPNSSSYGAITITAVADGTDSIGKTYRIEHGSSKGLVVLYANTGQYFNFNGTLTQYLYLYDSGQYVEFYWNQYDNNWSVKDHCICFCVCNQNRSAWSNKQIGNGVTYDNKNEAVDLTGHIMSFYDQASDTGNICTCVIVKDTGGTGTEGILYFYAIEGGLNVFPDNNTITSANGTTTALVNETSGSNKNQNYNVYHGFNLSITKIIKLACFSLDKTEANTFCVYEFGSNGGGGVARGQGWIGNDLNSMKFQTSNNGIAYINTSGSITGVTTTDAYLSIMLHF